MKRRQAVVLGAGPAGLVTSLALARDDHRVTLIERDPLDLTTADEAVEWERKGIPHFFQPHAFIARGRKELRDHFPDVMNSLMEAGARDIDIRRKLPGDPRAGDDDLLYLGVRRPLIEWALREAVAHEPGVEVRAGVHVEGVKLDAGRIAGVLAGGDLIPAEVVVDAMGRRTLMRSWLSAAGHNRPSQALSECGVIYYSRYYRVRDGASLEDGPWLVSPRGDLGYMGFASFPGDQDTFAAVLAVPTGVPEFKVLRHEPVFEAAVATIPQLRMWVDPSRVEPVTPVLPMGSLQNIINHYDAATPRGLFHVGDALCHTDPVLAHGLSFSVIHGREVAIALRQHSDLGDAFDAYAAAVMPDLLERFDLATALDEQRHRMWTGKGVDFVHRTGDFALFSMTAAAAVAMVDGDVGRAYVRRIGLLDSTRVFDDDVPMQKRVEALFADLLAKRTPQGPPREEMLALCSLVAQSVKT